MAGGADVDESLAPPPHKYIKLESNNHIRVLILHPSQDPSAALRCSIKQHELGTSAEQYECISYTWRNQLPSFAHILHCDDGSVVEITANLQSALSRFRFNSHTRCLWADAVCINQADPEEKSRQIPIMPGIYRNASKGLVWLGGGTNGESETIRFLARRKAHRLEPLSSDAQASIRNLFQLPWFGHRWAVQEAVLNPDVMFYCRNTEISWPRLHLAIQFLPDYFWNFTSGSEVRRSQLKLGELWRKWSYFDRTKVKCELFDLLDSFHHFECKEPKDRIYALAGLASDVQISTKLMPLTANQGKIPFVPDYSLSDDEVFRQVALRRMQAGKVFTTLAYAGALRPRDGSRALPSWAPDFRLSKLWRTLLKEDSKSYIQPRVQLSSRETLTLEAEVCTPHRQLYGNAWNSCVVRDVFPGPRDSEPRDMLQFVRDCLHWMHSIPTLVNFTESFRKNALCDVLITAAKFGKEEDKMGGLMSDVVLSILEKHRLDSPLPTDFPNANEGLVKAVRWFLLSLLDDEDSEGKYRDAMMPYISVIFKELSGRCFFMSNTVTVSER